VDDQIGDHSEDDNDSKDDDEGSEEDDEDDGEDGSDADEAKKLFALNVTGAGLFREWLKSVVQWARTLRDLSSRKGVGSLIRSRNLQFKLVDNPHSLASVQFPSSHCRPSCRPSFKAALLRFIPTFHPRKKEFN
jgi:hypothetical protein